MAHRYPLTLSWRGNTVEGAYSRDAVVNAPGKLQLPVSSAAEYAGTVERWNPEDMLGAALATCHMLTFLALAAKTRIEVTAYEDHAEAVLDTVEKVTSITEIVLKPTIRVPRGTDAAKVVELFEKAHKYCFVANSIKSKVTMQPRVVEAS
ncbi:MAG TPA: OsmC family protein [Holophagaceae bacterium]|nr:OsmC family protein [Holophagaceae bacterium]